MIVAQVTGHFTDVFKASTWELHSVTSTIVRRRFFFLDKKRGGGGIRPLAAASEGSTTGLGDYAKKVIS